MSKAPKFVHHVYFSLIALFIFSCDSPSTGDFVLGQGSEINIYMDSTTHDLIKWAVNDLARDLREMTDQEVNVFEISSYNASYSGVLVGAVVDEMVLGMWEEYPSDFINAWETFVIETKENNLHIVGSDVRGTLYGIFEVAERLGISPWKWWADVVPTKKDKLVLNLPESGLKEGPSVKYRGIFLNDEDWGLQPWAAKTFESEVGDIGPKTYEKIFQLLLRLKANAIWPAMHPSTKAFYTIPGNREMAEKYQIFIGTSHAEPMLRNNVDEWDHEAYGDYNYFTNSERVKSYWEERIQETKCDNAIITLGMRGIHDSGMEGNASKEERVALLEGIITDQRKMLTANCDQEVEEVPQVLIPYKEVLDLYNSGLQVPDDVTLVWTDDNYGYIRRFSNEKEQQRSGGGGVYYHISYWGRPHDYLWLSSTQPGLIWYEMSRAYQNGAQNMWIVNVGDIKPAEYNMEFFLDLAWDISSIGPASIDDHLEAWATREFGGSGADIAGVMKEYYRLAFLRKPEFMGWSQTEPTRPTHLSEFNLFSNEGELDRRLDAYATTVKKVDALKGVIPQKRLAAYFELVEYPVKGAALMNDKFLYAKKAFNEADRKTKAGYNDRVVQAQKKIEELTEKYNEGILDGKWKEMMKMNPRNLPVFQVPDFASENVIDSTNTSESIESPMYKNASDFAQSAGILGYEWVEVEGLGYSGSAVTLSPFTLAKFGEENRPSITYSFEVKEAGKYEVVLRFLPTHSNEFDHEVWVEFDGLQMGSSLLNTKGRSEEWKVNVLRNGVLVKKAVDILSPGTHNLKVLVNQTGIVLDQLAIHSVGYPNYYEIRKAED